MGLAASNGSLPPGLWLTSPAGCLPRTGISSGTLRSVIDYGLPLPFYFKVEEICDVEFLRCMITPASCSPHFCCDRIWLRIITPSTIFARPSSLRLLFDPIAYRTLAWYTVFKWQRRGCFCGGLSSVARIVRWALLQDWNTEEQERWNKCNEVRGDYAEKRTGRCCCIVLPHQQPAGQPSCPVSQQIADVSGTELMLCCLHTYCHTYYWYSITHSLFHSRLKSFLFCKSSLPHPLLFLI